ncbi:MAG: hypothetical protein WAX04_02215 [Oscillospiraceae bacterium]
MTELATTEYEKPIDQEELCKRMGYSRFTILRLRKFEGFPSPVRRKYLWSEVVAWQAKLKVERKNQREADREQIESMIQHHLDIVNNLKRQLNASV